eukprot:TRINITY_DN14307_c0_g1_i1.p1 TRINITY_DN14307_c0_g1~~TRINITY_DN14307_c0_g1_i1.p1  ORF type:complete len:342 (-),score=30.73 TRINITY_DN14307_c0_g1_i1:47-1072(-)
MCFSTKDGREARSREIDRSLKLDAKRTPIKVLLLGTGESGKSTFSKQLKLIHGGGFGPEEKAVYRRIVHQHLGYALEQIKALIEENADVKLTPKNLEALASLPEEVEITAESAQLIKDIYADPSFDELSSHKSFHQLDNTQFFLTNIDRIAKDDYVPTDEDCLRCRNATTGVQEMTIGIEGHDFLIVDVGGQRSERRKWAHCFENVDAIIYMVSLSEYDQTLFEDGVTNRMVESMNLFDHICNMKWFMNVTLILFLNKKDIFETKIKTTNITSAFPNYEGPQEYQPAAEFISNKFLEINKSPERKIYPYMTCATDTDNVKVVFKAVKDTILTAALRASGLC